MCVCLCNCLQFIELRVGYRAPREPCTPTCISPLGEEGPGVGVCVRLRGQGVGLCLPLSLWCVTLAAELSPTNGALVEPCKASPAGVLLESAWGQLETAGCV
ncbi:hypothetical protein GOODEAATRI_011043 [Goodea atripinnis]|uniref:Uncharacterized protein n=1 Tax=Goodea atripinnis TaxID=208336 RepID=A0ABV0NTN4_9TELE